MALTLLYLLLGIMGDRATMSLRGPGGCSSLQGYIVERRESLYLHVSGYVDTWAAIYHYPGSRQRCFNCWYVLVALKRSGLPAPQKASAKRLRC